VPSGSYSSRTGSKTASTRPAHLATALKGRGYEVWRDELKDRDGQPFIGPGSEAQETIQKAILDHGFVLVIDSPEASQSRWVHAEIDTAYAHMLPMLPVVIEDAAQTVGQANIPIGGRFQVLREMQRQVRVTVAHQTGKTIQQVMNAAWLDGLEKAMSEVLLGHLRSRLILTREAEHRFKGLWVSSGMIFHPRTCCTRRCWTGIAQRRPGWLSDCWFSAPRTM